MICAYLLKITGYMSGSINAETAVM